MNVIDEINAERWRQQLSKRDLSNMTGIRYTTMRNSLAGRRDFNTSELAQISNALGVPAWELIRRAEEKAA